jgi:hypothetical protein
VRPPSPWKSAGCGGTYLPSHPSNSRKHKIGRSQPRLAGQKKKKSNTLMKKARSMAHVVKQLPSRHAAQSSNPVPQKKSRTIIMIAT